MRLRRSRGVRFTGPQLIVGVVLGIASGIYVWKPEFDRHYGSNVSQEELDRERQKTLANFDLPESQSKADAPPKPRS